VDHAAVTHGDDIDTGSIQLASILFAFISGAAIGTPFVVLDLLIFGSL
jgi:hypothetical protein